MAYPQTILVVDDDKQVRQSLQRVLRRTGYETVVAPSGRQAIQELQTNTFDLVLLDLVLPDMDGQAVMDYIKRVGIDTPVVLITGHASTDSAVQALRSGAYDYLQKPVEPDELIKTTRNALELMRLRREEVKARKALEESEHYSRTLFGSLQEEILVIDREHRIADVSLRFLENKGFNREDVIGRCCYEVSHRMNGPCDTPGGQCLLGDVFRTGVPARHYHQHLRADGSTVWFDILFSPLADRDGKITHAVKSIRDISDLKRAEEERARMERALLQTQKSEALGRFAGVIAHDFNNVLGHLLCHAELSLAQLPEGSQAADHIEKVLDAVNSVRELVDRIGSFSGNASQDYEFINMAEVINEALALLKPSLPKRCEVGKVLPSGIGRIFANRGQIRQILLNVCENAAQAVEQRGSGSFEVRLDEIKLDAAALERHEGLKQGVYLRITVEDEGIGMDEYTLARVFEPFFASWKGRDSVGLGLAVVKGIVEGHGGAVAVSSVLGKGSSLEIYLPKPGHISGGKPDIQRLP